MDNSTSIFDMINDDPSVIDDDFDLGIDFETAYNIFNDELNDDMGINYNNNNNAANDNVFMNVPSPLIIHTQDDTEHNINNSFHNQIDPTAHIHDLVNNPSETGLPQSHPTLELLTSIESNAIEHFFDSLMTSNPSPTSTNFFTQFHKSILSRSKTETSLTPIPTSLLKPDSSFIHEDNSNQYSENIFENDTQNNDMQNNDNDDNDNEENYTVHEIADYRKSVYISNTLELPEFKIPNSEIPNDILHDINKVKKWKHVKAEKQRRNSIKQSFENLISLIKLPRDTSDPIHKLSIYPNDKRVPKYASLNYILQDIKSLIYANEQLEFLVKNDIMD